MVDKRNINSPLSEHDDIETSVSPNDAAKVFDTAVFAVDFAKGTRKFWYIVVVFAVALGLISGYLKYSSYTPMYESSVSFSVSAVSYSSSGVAVYASYYDNSSAAQLSKTFPYIINTSMMRNSLMEALGTTYINGSITASAVADDSNIFKVSVVSSSPEDAFNIVNAVIDVYPDVAMFVVGNIQLKILIKPTMPTEPYTTNNFIRTGAIMALVGATLGFGVIALYAFFRNTVRKKEDFKNKLNQKCYVEIPYVVFYRKTNDKKLKRRLVRLSERHPTFKEAFRLLRKRLLRNLNSNEKIIGVTSAAQKEGKTTVALNLAHAFAISGKKTACVDLDFNSAPLQKYLADGTDFIGVSDVINAETKDFGKAINIIEDELHVYYSGNEELYISEKNCSEFFDYLRTNYDYVIVNMPCGNDVANSVAIGNMCDCIMLVAKQDTTSIDKIRKTLESLSFSTSRILGFVFNGVQDGFSGYGGYYGKYGYGKYGYGKYGYGKYGYGKYGYGKYGYGKYGYGYGYGYGDDPDDDMRTHRKHRKHRSEPVDSIDDSDIPDNNL